MTPLTRRPARRASAALAASLAAVLLLAGCSAGGSSDLTQSYNQGDAGGGYISGDGRVVAIAESEREEPVEFGGELDTGGELAYADLADKVVLLNFWYANCPPCRKEAPDLEELHQQYIDDDRVMFLGVNVEDSAARSQTFAEEYGVTYPSILDQADNEVQLAFSGKVPPNAVPTTLILDAEGRVAARISGVITDTGLVSTLIDDALAEAG